MKRPVPKPAFVLAAACVVFAAPALAQSPPDRAASPSTQNQPAQTAQPQQNAPSTADFVKAVAISDMFEIQSSKLALEKKSRGDRQFARRMIHDHGQTSEQLKRLVADGRVTAPLPTGLDGAHQQMLDQLRNDNGADFDKTYDQMQLNGHKEAIALFESYARNGDNAALKSWAATTLPHLQEHLALAEKLSQR
jgi:putative membrane protein